MLFRSHLVLSSGRPLESILKTRDELNLCLPNMYVIAYNGALIYDCDANLPLSEFCVSFEEIKQLLALANTHNLHIHTYSDGQIITPQENEELQFYTKHIHMPYQVVPDLVSHLSKPPYKMIAIHLNEKTNPKLDDFGKVQ